MFIANTASVGHRKKLVEFVGAAFNHTTSSSTTLSTPITNISGIQSGDLIITCHTVSNSSVPFYPSNTSNSSGGPYSVSWPYLVQIFSNDTMDSATKISYAFHNGNSYNIYNYVSQYPHAVQVLAFRNVSGIYLINSGTSTNTSYVNFDASTSTFDDRSGFLHLGGGGQYRADYLGTYPDPGVHDNFDSYNFGSGSYTGGTVGYGFTQAETFGSALPSVQWDGSAYNNYRSSTFDAVIALNPAVGN